MELKIDVCTNESCKVTVTDISTSYQPEGNNSSNIGLFRYSDTTSIDILELIESEGNSILSVVFTKHNSKVCPVSIPIEFDGWFKIHHIVLPKKEWIYSEIEKEDQSILPFYSGVYYCDGEKIYKYINGKHESTSFEEIIEINTENTTISRVTEDYVSICFLRKCYINLCQLIFNSRAFDKCWNKNKIDSELVFKRDMVWMAINVIKYMVEFNQLYEASRIIERLSSCNGLCGNINSSYNKSSKCGCGCKNELWM